MPSLAQLDRTGRPRHVDEASALIRPFSGYGGGRGSEQVRHRIRRAALPAKRIFCTVRLAPSGRVSTSGYSSRLSYPRCSSESFRPAAVNAQKSAGSASSGMRGSIFFRSAAYRGREHARTHRRTLLNRALVSGHLPGAAHQHYPMLHTRIIQRCSTAITVLLRPSNTQHPTALARAPGRLRVDPRRSLCSRAEPGFEDAERCCALESGLDVASKLLRCPTPERGRSSVTQEPDHRRLDADFRLLGHFAEHPTELVLWALIGDVEELPV